MSQEILTYFKNIYDFYKEHVWKPYASIVSQNTITGLRAKEEKRKMAEREFSSVDFGKKNIDILSSELSRRNIEPTYEEYKLLSTKTVLDAGSKNTIDELFSIYQRKNDVDE